MMNMKILSVVTPPYIYYLGTDLPPWLQGGDNEHVLWAIPRRRHWCHSRGPQHPYPQPPLPGRGDRRGGGADSHIVKGQEWDYELHDTMVYNTRYEET